MNWWKITKRFISSGKVLKLISKGLAIIFKKGTVAKIILKDIVPNLIDSIENESSEIDVSQIKGIRELTEMNSKR